MDIFTKRDQYRKALRRKLCTLYSLQIEAQNNKDVEQIEKIKGRIMKVRKELLNCDPGEPFELFHDVVPPKKRKPRLPA